MSLMVAEHVELAQLDDLEGIIGDLFTGGVALYSAHAQKKLSEAAAKRAAAIDNKRMALLERKQGLEDMLANLQGDGIKAKNAAQQRQAEIQLKVQQAQADVEIAKLEQEQALNTIRANAIQDQLKRNIADGMSVAEAEGIAITRAESTDDPPSGGPITSGGTDTGDILGMQPLVFAGVAGGGALLLLGGLYFAMRKR